MASTTEELDELFRVRHRVFMREKRSFPRGTDGRHLDRFDAYPTTANLIAVCEGRVLGGVRIVEPSGCGTPADDFFDFAPYLPEGAIVGSGSMLVMDEELRRVPPVTFAMLGMMYYRGLCKGLTHLTALAAPDAEKLFLGSGYRPVCARFFHEGGGLDVLPVTLDVAALDDRFSAFIDKHQLRHFLERFERQFHPKGEHILRRGEASNSAYVIVEGRVGVSVGGVRCSAVPPQAPPEPPKVPPPPHLTQSTPPVGFRYDGSFNVRTASYPPPPPFVDPEGDGPFSVRNPGLMTDRGRMSEPPAALPTPSAGASGPLSVREMGPGEVFGELALSTAQPRSADVVALTDVDLMVLERDAFPRQVSRSPEVALNLLTAIGNNLMSVADRFGEVSEMHVDKGPPALP